MLDVSVQIGFGFLINWRGKKKEKEKSTSMHGLTCMAHFQQGCPNPQPNQKEATNTWPNNVDSSIINEKEKDNIRK